MEDARETILLQGYCSTRIVTQGYGGGASGETPHLLTDHHPHPGWRLPHWVRKNSGLLHDLLRVSADLANPLLDRKEREAQKLFFTVAPVGEERLWWWSPCPISARGSLQVRVSTGGATIALTRCRTRYQWENETGPCWLLENGKVFFRNLHVVQSTAPATLPLADYPRVPDSDLFWKTSGSTYWERETAENLQGKTSLEVPSPGDVQICYASSLRLSMLTDAVVRLTNGVESVYLPLAAGTPQTIFDTYGGMLGIPRLAGENNLDYRLRLSQGMYLLPGTTLHVLLCAVALRLGILGGVLWDGSSDLVLDEAGDQQITAVVVSGVAPLITVREALTAGDTTHFYATYPDWLPGWSARIGNLPTQSGSLEGNCLTFSAPVQDTVTADYSVAAYTLQKDADGYITGLTAGHGVIPAQYSVFYTRNLTARTAADPAVLDALLDSAGLPSDRLLEIAGLLAGQNPALVGQASWETAAVWLQQNEAAEAIYLPLSFHE